MIKLLMFITITLSNYAHANDFNLDHHTRLLKVLIHEQKTLKLKTKGDIIDHIIEERYDELKGDDAKVRKLYTQLIKK